MLEIKDFQIDRLGECRIDTPIVNACFIEDDQHVLYEYRLKNLLSPGRSRKSAALF